MDTDMVRKMLEKLIKSIPYGKRKSQHELIKTLFQHLNLPYTAALFARRNGAHWAEQQVTVEIRNQLDPTTMTIPEAAQYLGLTGKKLRYALVVGRGTATFLLKLEALHPGIGPQAQLVTVTRV